MSEETRALLTIIINTYSVGGNFKYVTNYQLVYEKEKQVWVLRIWYETKKIHRGLICMNVTPQRLRAIKEYKVNG